MTARILGRVEAAYRLVCAASLHFRFIPLSPGGALSFHVDQEGAFLWVWPFELALLRPGVQT